MLKENIKNLRKSKGLSQEELAVKLHVVRQTVSKWENGLSVPDAAELISLAEELDTPVGVLLGETVPEHEPDDMTALSEKLAAVNLQLAEQSAAKRKAIRWALIFICVLIAAVALGENVLAHGAHRFARDDLAADGRLYGNFEELAGDVVAQLFAQLARAAVGLFAVGNEAQRVHLIAV